MKRILHFAIGMLIMGLGAVHAQDVLVHSEGFESTTNWTTNGSCSNYPWKISSLKASEGSKSAIYESYYAPKNCYANLESPVFSVNQSGPQDSLYFYFDILRNSPTALDRIELSLQDQSGNVKLGPVTIYRNYNQNPQGVNGWNSYVFKATLSLLGTGNNINFKYVVKGISDYGDDIHIDNIRIYHHKSQQPNDIKLTNPNGGNFITSGSSYNITWYSSSASKVNIDFTIDGGLNWVNIASNVNATDYTYTWIVPNASSKTCKVRIVNADNSNDKDESDSYFTISDGTGIEENSVNLKLYPNPVNDRLNLELESDGEYTAYIVSVTGEVVKQANVSVTDGKGQIGELAELPIGIYVIELKKGDLRVRKHFTIIR